MRRVSWTLLVALPLLLAVWALLVVGTVVTVIAAGIFLYGILHFFSLILLVISWGYVILGLILALIRRIAGKKSKTLEDFEPDEEE